MLLGQSSETLCATLLTMTTVHATTACEAEKTQDAKLRPAWSLSNEDVLDKDVTPDQIHSLIPYVYFIHAHLYFLFFATTPIPSVALVCRLLIPWTLLTMRSLNPHLNRLLRSSLLRCLGALDVAATWRGQIV